MKVESQTTVGRRLAVAAGLSAATEGSTDWRSSPPVLAVLKRLGEGGPCFIARAPGRLNIMGGVGEYTGGLVLNLPTAQLAYVGIRRCPVPEITIACQGSPELDGRGAVTIPAACLYKADHSLLDPPNGWQLLDGSAPAASQCVLGTVVEMVRAGLVSDIEGGLRIAVASTPDGLQTAAAESAFTAATAAALAAACGAAPDPFQIAVVCQRVANDWLRLPIGIGNAVCALLGEPGVLAGLRCESPTFAGSVRLADNVVLLGIDCGVVHHDAKRRFERVRTATFMGRALIDRIIRHEGPGDFQWDGYLAQISITDYVERFRDRLPTKLKGGEYLARFGEAGDPLTRIDEDFVYKIRSRTEHHVYEHARACQFIECLSRAIRNSDERGLREAGDAMYASHWSYGQRCGLGSVETDLLVNLLRSRGSESGLYGAKITACGCGGVVAVLMRADERAAAAVAAAVGQYESQTGRKTALIRGYSAGAIVEGVRRM